MRHLNLNKMDSGVEFTKGEEGSELLLREMEELLNTPALKALMEKALSGGTLTPSERTIFSKMIIVEGAWRQYEKGKISIEELLQAIRDARQHLNRIMVFLGEVKLKVADMIDELNSTPWAASAAVPHRKVANVDELTQQHLIQQWTELEAAIQDQSQNFPRAFKTFVDNLRIGIGELFERHIHHLSQEEGLAVIRKIEECLCILNGEYGPEEKKKAIMDFFSAQLQCLGKNPNPDVIRFVSTLRILKQTNTFDV